MVAKIYLKGGWFQNIYFIGDYKTKDGLISIYWKECKQKDIVYKDKKLLGFIPWGKREMEWVDAALPETPNPYIIPLVNVSLIEELK